LRGRVSEAGVTVMTKLHGLLVGLKRQQRTAAERTDECLGRARLREVATSLIFPEGLRSFYIVRALKSFLTSAKVTIDQVGHRGEISGWAFDPSRPHLRLSLSVVIDGVSSGSAVANIFRLDPLRAGLGDGAYGFSVFTGKQFLDGAHHEVLVSASDPAVQKTPLASARKRLLFPKNFTVVAPWRNSHALNAFERIKHRIMSGDLSDEALTELRAELDREPRLIFNDAGIVEASRRAGKPFVSLRERLAHRFESPDCPELIHRFSSKSFTKSYCLARGLPTPKTLLLTSSLKQIKAFDFPDRFVIKPVKDSGVCNFLYDKGVDLLSRRALSMAEILESIEEYKRRKPGAEFIIEEALRQKDAADQRVTPLDYKLHVFGGKVRIIHVDDRNVFDSRDQLYRQQGWYSADWRPAPFRMRIAEEEAIDFRKPEQLSEMMRIAESIGAEARDYIRVDLYDTGNGVVVGELATFSHAGLGFTDYGDLILSQAWHVFPALPEKR
jgi:TupA-like ATPgrasp